MIEGNTSVRRVAGDPGAAMRSPFQRLRDLLEPVTPGRPPINLSIGEPTTPPPPGLAEAMLAELDAFGRYPRVEGTDDYRAAVADWIARRFGARPPDPAREVIVLSGSREGLFLAALAAALAKPLPASVRPAVLMPNPYYQAYPAGALGANADAVALDCAEETGFLPDLSALPADLLERAACLYLASPASPQGAVVNRAYLARAIALCRAHRIMLFADECYSEIWTDAAPEGALGAAGDDFAGVVAFNSLSKRSGLPGLRCGFAAGDPEFLARFVALRNLAAPQVPVPLQAAGALCWRDEAHVERNRAGYRKAWRVADDVLGGFAGYRRADAGFFVWLRVGEICDGETFVARAWADQGVRLVPGAYLCAPGSDGANPGEPYVRIALVAGPDTLAEALGRLRALIDRG